MLTRQGTLVGSGDRKISSSAARSKVSRGPVGLSPKNSQVLDDLSLISSLSDRDMSVDPGVIVTDNRYTMSRSPSPTVRMFGTNAVEELTDTCAASGTEVRVFRPGTPVPGDGHIDPEISEDRAGTPTLGICCGFSLLPPPFSFLSRLYLLFNPQTNFPFLIYYST